MGRHRFLARTIGFLIGFLVTIPARSAIGAPTAVVVFGGSSGNIVDVARNVYNRAANNYANAGYDLILVDCPTIANPIPAIQSALTAQGVTCVTFVAHGASGVMEINNSGGGSASLKLDDLRTWLAGKPTGFLKEAIIHACEFAKDREADVVAAFRNPRFLHVHIWIDEWHVAYWWEWFHTVPTIPAPYAAPADGPPVGRMSGRVQPYRSEVSCPGPGSDIWLTCSRPASRWTQRPMAPWLAATLNRR